jgi:hypothetical protein
MKNSLEIQIVWPIIGQKRLAALYVERDEHMLIRLSPIICALEAGDHMLPLSVWLL